MDCADCPNALWEYEEYYNTSQRQWFVAGCRIGKDEEECKEDDDERSINQRHGDAETGSIYV